MTSLLSIQKQTEAEKDPFLLESFHDTGIISDLIESSSSIIIGRKGTGKTALARLLENKSLDFGIDYATRITLKDIVNEESNDKRQNINETLLYILVSTIQKIVRTEILESDSKRSWQQFLKDNHALNISDYQSFTETRRVIKSRFKLSGILPFTKGSAEVDSDREISANNSSTGMTPHLLFESILESIPNDKHIFIFIDDITDYLDLVSSNSINSEIEIVQNLLLKLDSFNAQSMDKGSKIRFISLLRNDVLEFMVGSNINKLKSSTLELEWNERDFASLLIKRLPFYKESIDESLSAPVDSIKKQFPDHIFSSLLQNYDSKRYSSNFYTYMMAISFNRPRDFLMFCYAMRDRLSLKHVAETKNIESAEIEYSNYFKGEIKDELYLASKIINFNCDEDGVNKLIQILAKDEGIGFAQIKSDLGRYLGEKTSTGNKKIEIFINELYQYGVLGYKDDKKAELVSFHYMKSSPINMLRIKSITFFLHRGMMWFAKKIKLIQQ